jgi:hypothetical protein
MKTIKPSAKVLFFGILTLVLPLAAFGHCPAHSKSQKVCVMLDENKIYIWDEKLEHNGPYKDLKDTLKITDANGKILVSKKLARGVYQIESKETLKSIVLEVPEKLLVKEEHKH